MATSGADYDEFGLFHENADEFGLPFDEPPSVRREFVEVEPGRRLSALVWGLDEPELVLLHGGGQNAHTWDTVAMALRPRSLVAIDLPGHGHSDGPGDRQRLGGSPKAAAGDVAQVVRSLAPFARGVVGMSYGGMTAIALTEIAPDLVRKLLLVDVLPGMTASRGRHIVEFLDGPASFADFDELLARTVAFNPTRRVSSLRRGILHNAVQLDDGRWAWRHSLWRLDASTNDAPSLPSEETRAARDAELMAALGRIEVPLLLARGMRPDSVLGDDDEAELLRRLPSAQVVRFDEAGHSIQGDMPLELAATIQTFIP